MKPIKEIAEILFGVYAKVRSATGGVLYLQIGDFDAYGNLVLGKDKSYINQTEINNERQFLTSGDILLPAKGLKNAAFHINEHHLPAVASSLFFVIRLQDRTILPQFLAIYLNHPATQSKIKAMISSTLTVPVLNKKEFQELPVPIISLAEQKEIIQLHHIYQQERAITIQLLEKKEQLFHGIFTQIITQDHV